MNLEEDLVILDVMRGMVEEKQILYATGIDSEEEAIEDAENAIRKRHLELTNSLPSTQSVDIETVMKEIESVNAHKQSQSSNMVKVILEKREDGI